MDNLIFSLNATLPFFFLMALGYIFHKLNIITDAFASSCNTFVFKISLPVMLFHDLASISFRQVWDVRFLLFCFLATLLSIAFSAAVSFLWKDRSIQGEYIQASYRSSAALLGVAFIQNIYGTSGIAPLMIIASAPLYNIMAVIVLSFFGAEHRRLDRKVMASTLLAVLKNPIILGIAAGALWSLLNIPFPTVMAKTTDRLGSIATPLGLMAMGASFDFKKAFNCLVPSLCAAFTKLIGFVIVFLPIAVWMGFRDEKLIAILVMLGSATTVASFVMAKNMGHDGVLTSSVVMLTTLLCSATLAFWLFVLKTLGLI